MIFETVYLSGFFRILFHPLDGTFTFIKVLLVVFRVYFSTVQNRHLCTIEVYELTVSH